MIGEGWVLWGGGGGGGGVRVIGEGWVLWRMGTVLGERRGGG